MKNLRFLIPVILVFLTSAALVASKISVQQISQKNNVFAFDLFQKIEANQKGNIFFSPFSISTALAMTYAGANGNTAAEMQSGMHFFENTPEFHYAYGNYLEQLEKNTQGNIKFRVANKLWGEKTYQLQPDFIALNKEAYHSSLTPVNFIDAPESSRALINSWVANKTENKIKDLLPQGSITKDSRLVLTNAVYFKGNWRYQFDKKDTKNKKFFVSPEQKVDVPFMHQQGALSYTETENYQMVRLPYKGNKQSMIVVLPKSAQKMKEVTQQISQSSFNSLYQGYQPLVNLELPKFTMTLPLNLNRSLQQLGINVAFGQGADFSKMTPSNDLFISDVIHKAFIEVTEEGTEAAAATAVVMTIESVSHSKPPKPIEFKADHPFLIYILDDQTQSILFMGKVVNPAGK